MKGYIERRDHITRAMVQAERDKLFVYGDNMARWGLGGQAREMRGEVNTVGIPTKYRPDKGPTAYFDNYSWDDMTVRGAIVAAFDIIEYALKKGKVVVVPTMGVGTGYADLHNKAPYIYQWIEGRFERLEQQYAREDA